MNDAAVSALLDKLINAVGNNDRVRALSLLDQIKAVAGTEYATQVAESLIAALVNTRLR